jgi:phosphate transport system permease protein
MASKLLGINGRAKPAGEVWVWMSSMGLAFGLLMVVGLLAIIVINGIGVFWPHPVLQIELREGSGAAIRDSLVIGGSVARTRERKVCGEADRQETREWNLFVANRDVYGFAFKYVSLADARRVSHPRDAVVLERMEYGHAIGFPVSLNLQEGRKIAFGQADFATELRRHLDEVVERRARIRDVEKVQIGRINRRLTQLALREKSVDAGRAREGAPEVLRAAIAGERKALQETYQTLAADAAKLRAQQQTCSFTYRLFTGGEQTIPLGQLVDYHFPNGMTLGQKLGFFFRRLWRFVSEEPREANTEGGIFPAIFGTFVMTLLMSVAVMPFGILAAIYLREYAKQGAFVRAVRISVNNLAGVPSIVFGVFGLGFFVYFVGGNVDRLFFPDRLPTPTFGTGGILWAALTLALMTVPVVIVATEEALAAVPRGMREGSLALGASKWQTILRIVLPASAPGILTGMILAMARGAGEVAPLMLVGVVKLAPSLPVDAVAPFVHLDQKFMHLGFHIYDLGFQSPDSDAAQPMVFATTFFLIALVVLLNFGAIVVRERLRRKFATGAF